LELLSLMDSLRVIELKQEGGRPTYGRKADDSASLQAEVVCPAILARVEQRNQSAGVGIELGNVGTF
jgi:hypothetical protein